MSKGFVASTTDGAILRLRVSPGAARTSIVGTYGEDDLNIKVAAPPAEGKANSETVRLLADLLGRTRSDVSVIWGASSRNKTVHVRGAEAKDVRELVSGHPP